jgi:UDP-N-acetyl-D-mannosaminuronic acid dehydrogenase
MQPPFSRVSVLGLGYIGLPTAAVLAGQGVEVIGVDINEQVVEMLRRGDIHIVETGLDVIVRAAINSGRLHPVTQPERAEAFLIAVPTPFTDGHQPDLAHVHAATKAIAPLLEPGNLVVLESTSPVGTTEQMAQWLADLRPDLKFPHQAGNDADIHIAHCPERVLPGKVLTELVENDRLIGGLSERSAQRAAELYRIFVQGECLYTTARTAEMAKLTENAFRDLNIAFANELSLICEHLNVDVWELIRLANRHPRVNILQPGPGVGGHCIAVDPWFIVAAAPDQSRLIRTAREVNDHKPLHVIAKIQQAASRFKAPVIACLGLSFKANIDDLRESPSLDIVEHLAASRLAELLIVEPYVSSLPPSLAGSPGVRMASMDEALAAADIIALLVDHREFAAVDRERLRDKVVIDTRGAWR